jgi:hypothetical protein
MKKYLFRITALLLCLALCLCGCHQPEEPEDTTVALNMNTEYPKASDLPEGDGKKTKVIILIGQSNATGCSITEYLKQNIAREDYARYESGFPSVLINYCLDDHRTTSEGDFVNVDLTCGSSEGFFGPEVGMADVLSAAYPDETVVILKYTMSGYSLHHHWLSAGERGSIYNAFLIFVQTYMNELTEKNYNPELGAICWMQGESDTTEFKASHYYDNQTAFVSYLREDLAPYAKDGIYFIDAGISDSPYCEPAWREINEAKRRFSEQSPLNLYFSTLEMGLTVRNEPVGDPDWGHYDAVSELKLGKAFGEAIVQTYRLRENH